jgi:hypothetical protein
LGATAVLAVLSQWQCLADEQRDEFRLSLNAHR